MNATNKVLSILAFYLSEYDMKAVDSLGFKTRAEALTVLSTQLGNGNNYLKLRRDEFDALPDSSSSRKGWRNRPPLREVVELAAHLHQFSFEELTVIVQSLINNHAQQKVRPGESNEIEIPSYLSEETIEQIINATDLTATLIIKPTTGKRRVYDKSIVDGLKKLYKGCCQICGENYSHEFNIDICEAHHIIPFSKVQNNDASNIIILCPNHHRLIHKLSSEISTDRTSFIVNGQDNIPISLDYHLKKT